ncbi:MAG: hypothetical protein OEW30_12195 [Acidimicrobiia bacterium]|nr:hypothetical protein [Acidimicrobiia bacterium]
MAGTFPHFVGDNLLACRASRVGAVASFRVLVGFGFPRHRVVPR